MGHKVFVTRTIPQSGLKIIEKHFETIVWEDEQPPSKERIIELAKDCDGLVTLLSDKITREVLEQLPQLRIIAQYAVGYDNIDVQSATERGIMVTNTPGVLTETTADLAWALILAASRRIVEADRFVRKGNWKVAWGPQLLLGRDVFGSTLGIIGMGRIGFAVAKRALGFNMRILFTSRSDTEVTRRAEKELGAQRVHLDTLLRESDIITIHVPLTSETKHLIDSEKLGLLKKEAVLINTARGPVIDELALAEALKSGKIRAAGLDVFKQEPLPKNSPLLELENVVLTPHIGSASVETRSRMAEICARNLIAGLKGERPPNLVNPEVFEAK